eukprot:9495671-Pyramimonas_sp.AAC.1
MLRPSDGGGGGGGGVDATDATADAMEVDPSTAQAQARVELERAREWLRGLVVDTLDGTDKKEPRVRSMLRWMAHCLTHRYPFVGVYHPVYTGPGEVANAVELFRPISDGPSTAIGSAVGSNPAATGGVRPAE